MKFKKIKNNINRMLINCNLKQFLAILLVSISTFIYAQTPTLIASGTYKASGAGASGIPTINFNIPAGKNRVMIISYFYERVHSPYSSNYLTAADGSTGNSEILPRPSVNGISGVYLDSNSFWRYNGPNNTDVYFTSGNSVRYISDAMGLPTGNYAVTFPGINLPENSGDEMMVNIEVFENANQTPVGVSFTDITNFTTSTNFLTLNGTAQAIPVGNAINNTIYLGSGGTTQGKQVNFSAGWTVVHQDFVSNSSGTSLYSGSLSPNEHDGISLTTAYRTIASGNPSFSVSRTSPNLSTAVGVFSMIAILPLARPSVTGTVYRDNNGLTGGIDGGGTGGGVWNTANSLWVNAVNSSGNVVATALVNTSGVFSFPTGGNLIEGDIITFQLSKNQGTVGQIAPAKELPSNWLTVGESSTSGPSDGTPNGEFTLTIGTTNSPDNITNRFGVTTCSAGATAPPVQNISIACPATFVNLNTAHTGTVPAGSSLVWYTNNTHSGTALSGTQITQAVAGTYYYAFYYDSTNNCYSPVSTPVFVIGYSAVDSDGDGIPDACDLDDDNDGILDTNEKVNCSSNVATATDPNPTASVSASGVTIQYTVTGGTATSITDSSVGFAGLTPIQGATVTYDFSSAVSNLKMWYADLDNSEYLKINYYDENNNRISNLISYVSNNVGTAKNISSDASFGLLIDATNNAGGGNNAAQQYVEVTTSFKVKKVEVTYNATRPDGTSYAFPDSTPDYYIKGLCTYGDTDNDGIPDYLDLDSDNDGCVDAREGDENVTAAQVVTAGGTVTVGTGSTASNQNLCASISCVDAQGVPIVVNSGGAADIGADQGQGIGDSQNNLLIGCSIPSFDCETGLGYLITNTNTSGAQINYISGLQSFNLGTGTTTVIDSQLIDQPTHRFVNGIGYNIIDNYIYGIHQFTNQVVRIGSDGSVQLLPTLGSVLNPANRYESGDVSPNGILYVYSTDAGKMYSINLNPSASDYLTPIERAGAGSLFFDDFAFSPVDGMAYGITRGSGAGVGSRLFRYNPTTNTFTNIGAVSGLATPDGVSYGTAFMDNLGNLYFANNNSGNTYKINTPHLATGSVTVSKLTNLNVVPGDGARCANKLILPVAVADTDCTSVGSTKSFVVSTNDNAGTYPINVLSTKLVDPVTSTQATSVTISGQGTFAINAATGEITFTSTIGYTGASVNYVIADSQGNYSSPAQLNLTLCSYCYKPGITDAGNTYPTKHGITTLGRAGADNENWPMARQSAWTVLESKEKGFVVNRVTTTADLANITNPVEGMVVYDEQADCLKIYTLKEGDSAMAWHCFTTQACPD